ncbi:DUF309 domain-containing protein [bacterium]|nr:DUF309 domain-containing protein [bacterium]
MRFPPYTYVPGGPWPHPKSHPQGHAHHTPEYTVPPIDPDHWQESETYQQANRLFDAGYYWEAHEAWERLWHASHRTGPVARMLKGLIKLAAAGVKIRELRPAGASTHAGRAQIIFQELCHELGPNFLGQDLESLVAFAERTKISPALLSHETISKHVFVVFDIVLDRG